MQNYFAFIYKVVLFLRSKLYMEHFEVVRKVKSLSCVRLFATSWTVAYQAPPSMGISRQEYWSGLPFPSPTWKSCDGRNTIHHFGLLSVKGIWHPKSYPLNASAISNNYINHYYPNRFSRERNYPHRKPQYEYYKKYKISPNTASRKTYINTQRELKYQQIFIFSCKGKFNGPLQAKDTKQAGGTQSSWLESQSHFQ